MVVILTVIPTIGYAKDKPATPIRVVAELNIGQTKEITLNNGGKVKLTLLGIDETRDDVRNIIREVKLHIKVDGEDVALSSGNYNLPVCVGKVKIDCPVTKGYLSNSMRDLWKITKDLEAQLVEINPLVLTPSGLVAVDGKMILDDDTAFRQPIVQELQNKKLTPLEKLAREAGFSFVELSGDIGILANGAGLTMALLDVLSNLGLEPANFLDVGGGASKERVYKALELIFKLQPKAVLVNIFGGITRCDIVAQAIIQALKDFSDAPPMIIRLTGTNEKEGINLLKEANLEAFQDVMNAVKKVKEVLSE